MGKLTDAAVRNAKPGRIQDGEGLSLLVKPNGSRFWSVRVMKDGKRVAMGLGGYPAVTLSKARDAAAAVRTKIKAGDDVLADKRQAVTVAKETRERTFEVVAKLVHAERKGLAHKTNALWLARLGPVEIHLELMTAPAR